jgi:hypothetical protein
MRKDEGGRMRGYFVVALPALNIPKPSEKPATAEG